MCPNGMIDVRVSQSVSQLFTACEEKLSIDTNSNPFNRVLLFKAIILCYLCGVCAVFLYCFPQSACVGCTYRQGRAFSFALRLSIRAGVVLFNIDFF